MYSEVAWELVSSGTQVQPQIILEPGNLPDYLSVFYDYDIYKDPWQRKVIQTESIHYIYLYNF